MPSNLRDRINTELMLLWQNGMKDLDLYSRIGAVLLETSMMKDYDDAVLKLITGSKSNATRPNSNAVSYMIDSCARGYFESMVRDVAAQTGADLAQIMNPDTRTPEQNKALLEAFAREHQAHMDECYASDYAKVMQALSEVDSLCSNPAAEKEFFAVYYFAVHTDMRPSETGQFTDTDKEALIAQYKRFDVFFAKRFAGVEHVSEDEWTAAFEDFVSVENPTNTQEIIERLTSVLSEKYIMPNNKLANVMTKGIIDIGKVTLEESRRGAKKSIETSCTLTYEGDNVHLSGRQPFTEYDRNVYDAVSSLYVYGDQSHNFTPAQVFRKMTGLTDTEKPTPGQLAAVTRSLDKMRFIRARIDCTAELQARRITLNSKQINGGEIDTYLLAADAIKVQAGGQTVKGYHIIKTPILYEYAAAVGQVLNIDKSTLDVKEIDSSGRITTCSLPNTEIRIVIRGYLIRRIEGMKGKNGLKNPVIALYDYEKGGETHRGLYSIAGKPDPARTEANRMREDVEKMLAYWKATGYIVDYETQIKGKKITGYKITV